MWHLSGDIIQVIDKKLMSLQDPDLNYVQVHTGDNPPKQGLCVRHSFFDDEQGHSVEPWPLCVIRSPCSLLQQISLNPKPFFRQPAVLARAVACTHRRLCGFSECDAD